MVDPAFGSLWPVERTHHRLPCAAWVCMGEFGTWVCLERKLGGMCVPNALGRGLLMQEWEGVCGRVWSVGVRREKEPREEGEEEGFHGVPGTPIAPREVASCQGVRSPVWERSSFLP